METVAKYNITPQSGVTVKVVKDEEPWSPREWDNLGKIVLFNSRRSDWGILNEVKGIETPEDFWMQIWEEYFPELLPDDFDGYESLSSTELETLESQPFPGYIKTLLFRPDWSPEVSLEPFTYDAPRHGGYYFATHDDIKKMGTPPEHYDTCFNGEIETLQNYLNGDVFGIIIEDRANPDKHRDSLWSIYTAAGDSFPVAELLDYLQGMDLTADELETLKAQLLVEA